MKDPALPCLMSLNPAKKEDREALKSIAFNLANDMFYNAQILELIKNKLLSV